MLVKIINTFFTEANTICRETPDKCEIRASFDLKEIMANIYFHTKGNSEKDEYIQEVLKDFMSNLKSGEIILNPVVNKNTGMLDKLSGNVNFETKCELGGMMKVEINIQTKVTEVNKEMVLPKLPYL